MSTIQIASVAGVTAALTVRWMWRAGLSLLSGRYDLAAPTSPSPAHSRG